MAPEDRTGQPAPAASQAWSVFVLGCGSIGLRHIANLRKLGLEPILAFDPVPERLDRAVRDYQVVPAAPEQGFGAAPAAVLVCTPPNTHLAIARLAVAAGAHLFIEKPIADRLDGLPEMLSEAKRRNLVVAVGYNLRFHAGLRRLKSMLEDGLIGKAIVIRGEFGQYLPDWRPGQDYRRAYTASAAAGGGIILEASHEFDYVRWLAGEVASVYCAAGHISHLEMDAEDAAAIVLRMHSGVIAELHLDCIQREYSRGCKVIGEEGTLVWDMTSGLRLLHSNKWTYEALVPDLNDMYLAEMRNFVSCIAQGHKPEVSGADGLRVLEIALAAKQSAALRQEVCV